MQINKTLTYLIAAVWLVNGLFCKVLNLVPRHREIVAQILGDELAEPLTILIGLAELVMVIWILSGFKPKINAATQILIVGVMNILEFFLVPELLLWGQLNIVFAAMFMGLVYYNAFVLNKKANE